MKIFLRWVGLAAAIAAACTSRATPPGGSIPPPKPVDPPQLAPTRTSQIVKPEAAQPSVAVSSAAQPAVAVSSAAQPAVAATTALQPAVAATSEAQPNVALASHHAEGFATTVRPILVAHCTPCHEPGGKMYDRLPFDRAETIASHRDGVLRRLKGDDRETVVKWLESQ
jgi:hypothetical protein